MARKNSRRQRRIEYANRNAVVVTAPNGNAIFGGISTTENREDAFAASLSTSSSNATEMGLVVGQTAISLTGRQARTLQRLLNKHYGTVGRSQAILGADDDSYGYAF